MKEVIPTNVKNLIEYKLYKKLSDNAWNILNSMDDKNSAVMGQSFLKAVDSIGVNIVKGFNEDKNAKKISFYEEAIIDLSEALDHWLELMVKRNVISKITYNAFKELEKPLKIKLKSRISSLIKNKK